MSCDEPCECPKLGIDYYGVLGITKNAHDSEINKAFRRLAIHYNPERLDKREKAAEVFPLVAEAYDVLSDPFKRAVYDQYGEEGLKKGVPGPDGYIRPYVYHGEPLRTYRDFFGTASPYADLLEGLWNPADVHDCPEGRGVRRKEEPLVHSLPLTLTEVFFGAVKMMKIQRLVFANDEKVDTVLRDKILTIPVKPGLATGTEIVFAEEGDQGPSRIPGNLPTAFASLEDKMTTQRHEPIAICYTADIIFVTEDRPHETFSREGDNLCMTVKIFLRDALVGTVVTVNTVDERILRVPVTSIITPDYRKLVTGEGLPLADNPERRGDLIISFDVEFPVYLAVASKNYVKKAFKVYRTGERSGDDGHVRRFILTDKMRQNVDDDIPQRRNRDDELERIKLLCKS